MSEPDPPPSVHPPRWAETLDHLRILDLFEKYRRRVVHAETDLPFAPSRRPQPLSLERLAFHTGGGLKLALRVFLPVCLTAFALSFLWDWYDLIRSCSVAGMIGFGTNWVAIKMLFWPRESRPFFGHGLIPSQRDDLIDKVATEVLDHLINEELILTRVRETKSVSQFTGAALDKLTLVLQDPEFTRGPSSWGSSARYGRRRRVPPHAHPLVAVAPRRRRRSAV